MPIITVQVIKDVVLTSPEQKRELLQKMTDAFISVVGDVARPYTYCIIQETPQLEWSIAGQPLPDLPFLYGPEYAGMHQQANTLMRSFIEQSQGGSSSGASSNGDQANGNVASATDTAAQARTHAEAIARADLQWRGIEESRPMQSQAEAQNSDSGLSQEEANKALFHRWFNEVWNGGNYEVAYEVISPTMQVHGAGGQPVQMGPDGLIGLIKTWRTAFPDGHMSVDGLVAEGDLVAALLTWRGTHLGEFYGAPPSGKQISCTSVGIDRMRGGKVVDGWGELDMVGMMQQMGALPVVGPGAVAAGRSAEWREAPEDAGDAGLSHEEIKALILKFVDAVNLGNRGAVRKLIDPAVYVENNPVWGTNDLESSMQLQTMLRKAMPDLRFTPDSEIVIAEGDKVAVHGVVSGTHTGAELFGVAATGKQVSWTHSDVVRIVKGKIVERWVSADTLSALQQLGVLPSQG